MRFIAYIKSLFCRDKVPFLFGVVCIVLVLLNGKIKSPWLNFMLPIGVIGETLFYLFWKRNRKP